jgi:hypothetical protein
MTVIFFNILGGKPRGKILCGISRRIWENNIKMDLRDIGCESMDWLRIGSVDWVL